MRNSPAGDSRTLQLRSLSKSYGRVRALEGVDLDLRAGEIHALVGENGAGKSTLLKILSGAECADGGSLELRGLDESRAIDARDLAALRSLSMRCVPQELELFEQLSACENCFGDARLPGRAGWISWRKARRKAGEAVARLDRDLPLERPLHTLAVPERSLLQIASYLQDRPAALALDEPTASLGDSEAHRLFEILRELRDSGSAILYVSHRLGEILSLADRVTVLRNGKRVWTREAEGLGEDEIVEAMVGGSLDSYFAPLAPPQRDDGSSDARALKLDAFSDAGDRFRNLDFTLRRGEILGIYGVGGSGKSELVQGLVGLRACVGRLRLEEGVEQRPFASPGQARRAGLAYVPGDRLTEGNLHGRALRENLTISSLHHFGTAFHVDRSDEAREAEALRDSFSIVAESLEAEIDTLSGGNQQKALIARALADRPVVLVVDEPTRGVDVGAKAEIHRRMAELAASGVSILLASTDLPEIFGLCHRVGVLREGELVFLEEISRTDEEEVTHVALARAHKARRDRGTGKAPVRTEGGGPGRCGRWARHVKDWMARELILASVMVALAAWTQWTFPGSLSGRFLADLLAASAPLALAAAGMMLVLASGAIDLSVGSTLAMAGASWALWLEAGGNVAGGFGLAVATGVTIGFLNAAICGLLRVPPIVATLGSMAVLRGLYRLWTRRMEIPDSVRPLALDGPLGLPFTAWIAAVFLVALAVFMHWRVEGRQILALGDNAGAARRHGIPAFRTRLIAFVVLGAATGLAAALETSRFGIIEADYGLGFELQAIAAAVLGGTAIAGGRGTVLGATLGALFLGLIAEVRAIWGIHERWQLMAIGALMLTVITMDRLLSRWLGGRS